MADRNQRSRYYGRDRDQGNWRQQEQFAPESDWRRSNDYEEGYGHQMSDPYGRADYGQRESDYETAWDRDDRYRRESSGYARPQGGYRSTGSYNYGPARYDTGTGRGFTPFTSEDQGGRDFSSPSGYSRGYRGEGGDWTGNAPHYGYGYDLGSGAAAPGYGYEAGRTRRSDERGLWDRASDEVASWFGDEDAARRREMDHSGRGPANYTRSDERILEDACDHLTEDRAVDARNVEVTVKGGEITLDGTVPDRQQKRRAEDVVDRLSGVRHVQNNLRVQETSRWDRSERTQTQAESADENLR